jgi:hypothetical protein
MAARVGLLGSNLTENNKVRARLELEATSR